MKKIVVMSDNHRHADHIDRIFADERDADFYIHCGDNEGNDEDLRHFYAVRGNNDWYSDLPQYLLLTTENKNIGITHGHTFGPFNQMERMLEFMEDNELDILCVGHTHRPMLFEEEGKIILNPGSTALPRGGNPPTYAIIYIDHDDVRVEFKEFMKEDM